MGKERFEITIDNKRTYVLYNPSIYVRFRLFILSKYYEIREMYNDIDKNYIWDIIENTYYIGREWPKWKERDAEENEKHKEDVWTRAIRDWRSDKYLI